MELKYRGFCRRPIVEVLYSRPIEQQRKLQINQQLEIQKEFLSKYKNLLLLLLENIDKYSSWEIENVTSDNKNSKEVEEDYVEVGGAD